MSSRRYFAMGFCLAVAMAAGAVQAAEGAKLLNVANTLRFEYDDNIYQRGEDETDSFKLMDSLAFSLDRTGQQSFLSLRYEATYVRWFDRPSDKDDLHHSADIVFNYTFSPRLFLGIKDTFMKQELGELQENGVVIREDNDYIYNTLIGTLTGKITESALLDMSARYVLLRYSEDLVGQREDYDQYVGGLTLRSLFAESSSVFADVRAEQIHYTDAGVLQPAQIEMPGAERSAPVYRVPDRSANTYSAGVGVEKMFSPNLLGSLRGGYMYKEYEAANTDDDAAPYAEATVTLVPSPATRITLGAGYSLYQSALTTFANQERSTVTLGLGHDVTSRISIYLASAYIHSEYDAESSVDSVTEVVVEDGSEDAVTFSARATYRINRMNDIEAGWNFINLDSDLRTEYDRNRYSVAWKVRL